MLPALPTGIARTSGARPRSSQISNAAGLLALDPVRVDRVDERDRVARPARRSARTTRSASSKLPSTATTRAPATSAWSSLPSAISPAGRTTTTSSPAAAPYAAADADVLPVEAQMIARAPSSSAFATATTMPRSLNEPVGFWPSTLRCRFGEAERRAQAARATSGVAPSPSVSDGRRVGDGQERAVSLDEPRAGVAGRGHGRPSRRWDEQAPDGAATHSDATGRTAMADRSVAGAAPAHVLPARGDRDEVAEHRGRGRRAAGARPLERDTADRLGLDLDPVEHAVASARTATPAGTAVGTDGRLERARPRRRDAVARSSMRPRPSRGHAPATSSARDAGDPGLARAAARRARAVPTLAGSIHSPNASRARITSLFTASRPSTSAGRVGLRVARAPGRRRARPRRRGPSPAIALRM